MPPFLSSNVAKVDSKQGQFGNVYSRQPSHFRFSARLNKTRMRNRKENYAFVWERLILPLLPAGCSNFSQKPLTSLVVPSRPNRTNRIFSPAGTSCRFESETEGLAFNLRMGASMYKGSVVNRDMFQEWWNAWKVRLRKTGRGCRAENAGQCGGRIEHQDSGLTNAVQCTVREPIAMPSGAVPLTLRDTLLWNVKLNPPFSCSTPHRSRELLVQASAIKVQVPLLP